MKVRVHPDGPWSVEHPDAPDVLVTLRPGDVYLASDPIVKRYEWAFVADNIEEATAVPGERRSVTRR